MENKKLISNKIFFKIVNRLKTIYLELVNMKLICIGHIPLHYVRRFFYRLYGVKIGKGSTIHMGAVFYNPRNIVIGDGSIIGEGAVLDGRDKLIIGNHVDIASEVMIYNGEHDINDENFKPVFGAVTINDYVFIGPRAIILPNVKIGIGAVIGAGAVVTKNVENMSIVGGVPAKEIGKRKVSNLSYRLGRAAWFR